MEEVNVAMRPALLYMYGSEIIVYSKTWVKALEVAQNQVARWVTGTGPRATRIGLRGKLGWLKMECEIWEKEAGILRHNQQHGGTMVA